MSEEQRVGEVIDACTTSFLAQSYELYQTPPLGSLVKTGGGGSCQCLYGVVYNILTTGVEPGRKPIARGKEEVTEDEIYKASPQLFKLLKSEFSVLMLGYQKNGGIFQYLPPIPARIHSFVYLCPSDEVKQFSQTFDFFNILLKARLEVSVEELVGATLRQMCQIYGGGKRSFLVSAGKELASLLSDDYGQLKAILKGLKYDAT
jgi:hypothetical protein